MSLSGLPVCRPGRSGARPVQAARIVICRAAPPVASAKQSKPLTFGELVGFCSSGCKPRDQWRIGTEHEKLGFKCADGRRLEYEQIEQLLTGLVERFGWEAMMEDGKIIGCKANGESVTLEPGGQFELSGAPLANLHETQKETNSHLDQVNEISKELGIAFLGTGFDPQWDLPEISMMPKGRYTIMRNYMPKVGTMGHDMMFRSCTIQVNLDFESEADMIEKMRIGIALQPISTALFANSPFRNGKPSGFTSWRSNVWTDTDNQRCGNLPFVFDADFSFEKYVNWVLDVPMYFVYRDGVYLDATGHSFRDFVEGKLPFLPGEYANLSDWESHMTTVFPEVRLKKYIEMRGADGGPREMISALPALWTGLLYDEGVQAQCMDLISGWTMEDIDYLRAEVPSQGLNTPFRDGTVLDVARKVLALSREGLVGRKQGEEVYLDPLDTIVESGESLSDTILRLYNTEWEQSVDPLYKLQVF